MANVSENSIVDVLNENWSRDARNRLPYSGEAVRTALQGKLKELDARVGYLHIPDKKGEDNLYRILGFRNEEDYNTYAAMPEEYASLIVQEVVIPIDTDAGVRYSARLYTDRSPADAIVSVSKDYNIGIRYSGTMQEGAVIDNVGIAATVTFQRSADGGNSWTDAGSVRLNSRDQSDTGYDTVNIGQFFGPTNPQQLRMRASYQVVDDDGNVVQSVQSAWTTFGSIIYTEIGLQYADAYEQPIVAASTTQFPLRYNLKGEVARTLHVRITGSKGTGTWTYAIGANQYTNFLSEWSGVAQDDTDAYGLLTHGVKTIEAWLTCSDGTTADAIESGHVTSQRMVVVDEADTTPRLLIQNLQTEVVNYVSGKLCDYAVYAPAAESVAVTFRLSNYQGTLDYLKLEASVAPNTRNSLPATVEIEDAVNDELFAYFHAEDSTGTPMADVATITVDNRDKFAPTLGADFFLNPKTRNNSEANPFTIINAMTGEVVEGCTFENFGAVNDLWVQAEDGQRVLRVLAGQKLTINYDWLKGFAANNAANVTMEIDFNVRNVTDEDTPIIDAAEDYGSGFLGFRMKPMHGELYTKKNVSPEGQDFRLQEFARTHVAVNIVSELRSTADSDETTSLCRVFINNKINREFDYDKASSVWRENGSQIVIGQDSADIDIYSIRIYQKAILTADEKQNYTATLPTSEEKQAFRKENDLLGGNALISADKCVDSGKNIIIWHGTKVGHPRNPDAVQKATGWYEIKKFTEGGVLIPELSGTVCKATALAEMTRQGTTANTYFDSNFQTKLKDIRKAAEDDAAYRIIVQPQFVHPDYIRDYLDGVAPIEPIEVPDGWIDGNGMYRGARYLVDFSVPYADKMVGKINYASSMQSHLMGACNMFNDLHTIIVGKTTMQQDYPNARVAKYEEPFLYFTQADDNATPVFQGPVTWGSGKMDEGTLGYDKKKHPNFCMMEGADNNLVLTDFRTPWEKKYIEYEIEDGEAVGFTYNGNTSFDLDKFKADEEVINGETVEVPNATVLAKIEEFVNFVYMHDPRIKVYVGPWSGAGGFLQSSSYNDTNYKYWCTEGSDAYKLRRWNEVEQAWVEAGWDAETQQVQVYKLNEVFPTAASNNAGQWDAMNTAFIRAIADDAKANIGDIIHAKSLRFHYNFVNVLLAGTDNCSKNTYYVLDPGTLKWMLFQDDMDTIFATDNSGFQTKPYYIDRQHPAKDGSTMPLYEGMANALFNLCEAMWEESGENRAMMYEILSAMSTLVKDSDDIPWVEQNNKKTPWGAMWKYFFSTQKYYPAVVYNETARIRYEYPTTLGFVSDRNVRPITQSMGDQLESELQYMKRRLVLFASYAEWGDFEQAPGNTLGISDVADVFGIQAYPDANGKPTEIKFTGLVTHQYMYPSGYVGTTTKPMRVRCKPGVSYSFDMTGGSPVQGDTACALFASNYFREFGNLGDLSVNPNRALTINARRLVKIEAKNSNRFRPSSLLLNTPLIEEFNLFSNTEIKGSIDLAKSVRLKAVDTRIADFIQGITVPDSRNLSSLELGAGMISVEIPALPNLQTVSLGGYSNLTSISIESTPNIDAQVKTIVNNMYNANPANLTSVRINGVDWSGFNADVLMWLAGIQSSQLMGRITMTPAAQDRYITLAEKLKLIDVYGNIDSTGNPLYLSYSTRAINSISLSGDSFIYHTGVYDGFVLNTLPASGNNVAVRNGREAVKWTLDPSASPYAVFTDDVKGLLSVKQLSDPALKQRFPLTVTVTLMDGSTLTATRNVGFYRRIPEIGDFAYADGTFDDQYDNGRDLVGAVVIKNKKSDTEYELIIDAKEDISLRSTGGTLNSSSYPWGLYPDNAATNGFPTEVQDAIKAATGLNSATDTAMANVSNTGLKASSLPGATGVNYINEDNYLDDNTEDGYAVLTSGSVNDFDSKNKTSIIIRHCRTILGNYLDVPVPTTLEELANAMSQIRQENDNKAKYYQFYYPAAYACRLYEPKAEGLDEQYQKGKWDLPANGVLARIYNFYNNSRGRITGTSPSADYANESPASPARLPLYANLLKRVSDAGGGNPFAMRSATFFWSSTEVSSYGSWYVGFSSGNMYFYSKFDGYRVRAVAAFTFTL